MDQSTLRHAVTGGAPPAAAEAMALEVARLSAIYDHQRHRAALQARRAHPLQRSRASWRSEDGEELHQLCRVPFTLGSMTKVCPHCEAIRFKDEAPGICCMNGAVQLPFLVEPPEPLSSLLSGRHPLSGHFRKEIRSYNSSFALASSSVRNQPVFGFGLENFRINGMVHHVMGALNPGLHAIAIPLVPPKENFVSLPV